MWGLAFSLGFVGLVALIAMTWASIVNLIFNIKMGKIWKAQEYKYKELHKCPKCGFPHVWGHFRSEGIPPFIVQKYYWENLNCHKCGYHLKFLVKWNGFNGGEE